MSCQTELQSSDDIIPKGEYEKLKKDYENLKREHEALQKEQEKLLLHYAGKEIDMVHEKQTNCTAYVYCENDFRDKDKVRFLLASLIGIPFGGCLCSLGHILLGIHH